MYEIEWTSETLIQFPSYTSDQLRKLYSIKGSGGRAKEDNGNMKLHDMQVWAS